MSVVGANDNIDQTFAIHNEMMDEYMEGFWNDFPNEVVHESFTTDHSEGFRALNMNTGQIHVAFRFAKIENPGQVDSHFAVFAYETNDKVRHMFRNFEIAEHYAETNHKTLLFTNLKHGQELQGIYVSIEHTRMKNSG